jgi:hypothetical protein
MKRLKNTSSARMPQETKPEKLNRLILGGGTGGTIAAWTFAQRVAVIRDKLSAC